MPKGQGKGAICNISVNLVIIWNTLSHAADSNGLVVLKIKQKLQYRGTLSQ